jgi:hypothetical protein
MLTRNWLSIILIPVAVALILYFVILPSMEEQSRSKMTDNFVGTWTNESRNITIIFHQDGTYTANNNNSYYSGNWKITNVMMHHVNLNWEGFSADYMFLFYENELTLAGVNEPAGLVYLSKT